MGKADKEKCLKETKAQLFRDLGGESALSKSTLGYTHVDYIPRRAALNGFLFTVRNPVARILNKRPSERDELNCWDLAWRPPQYGKHAKLTPSWLWHVYPFNYQHYAQL